MLEPCDSFCSALSQLAGLEEFQACTWSPELLAALANCSKLTCLAGGWVQGDCPDALQLPHIQALKVVHGDVPVCAFPGLTALLQAGPVSSDVYPQLSQHCTGLVCLTVPSHYLSLEQGAETSQRTGAIQALAGLTSLQRLALGACEDAEVAAYAQVVAALTRCSLKSASLLVPYMDNPEMSACSLMHVAQIVGLDRFGVDARFLALDTPEVRMLLQALHGITNAWVTVLPTHKAVFQGAESWLRQAGLQQHQLGTLTISVFGPDAMLEMM
jgi:hypothetical protein